MHGKDAAGATTEVGRGDGGGSRRVFRGWEREKKCAGKEKKKGKKGQKCASSGDAGGERHEKEEAKEGL